MEFSWRQAKHKVVRELGWSLYSPSLLELSLPQDCPVWRPPVDEEALYLLSTLDQNPAPLEQYLDAGNDRRLGARFESLWAYFFENHSFFRVLSRNRQIIAGKQTLGALDFVIEDGRQDQIVHLELAVKFYLYFPPAKAGGMAKWIGPNPDDNLNIKYDHLLNHQLPMSRKPETVRALKAQGIAEPRVRTAIVKGYLFLPLDCPVKPPAPVNPRCAKGLWISRRNVDKLSSRYPNRQWHSVEKEKWLDPALPDAKGVETPLEQPFGSSDITAAQLLTANIPDEDAGGQIQTAPLRCFLMPDSWPARLADC